VSSENGVVAQRLDPGLVAMQGRLEQLGYTVVSHGDHLCVRLPLLTSVRIRLKEGGRLHLMPQFGPFRRSNGLLATTAVATAAVAGSAFTVGLGPLTALVAFLGVAALAHDACRFVISEGALTRLQLLSTEPGAMAPGAPRLAAVDSARPALRGGTET
jgi:hypothetical protein